LELAGGLYMIVALTGFIAGLGHVLSGPDHLAALAPFSVDRPRRALRVGVQWAIGHSCGVALIALGSMLLREIIPVHFISSYSERAVGILLIAIGLWGLRKAFATRIHAHHHSHDGEQHMHIHVHRTGHRHSEQTSHFHSHAALGIGTLHGLAGGSHLLGVLPALALPSQSGAMTYLLAFGIGTLAGIGLFSSALGYFAHSFGGAGGRPYRYLMCGCSSAAVVVGGAWLVL
jgi:ABC-type nickel/cobalt efflux system permease component RcnA